MAFPLTVTLNQSKLRQSYTVQIRQDDVYKPNLTTR